MEKNELYHYGVLGMRWGVRKRSASQDSSKVKEIRKKRISEMSNQELRDVNNRLQLERQYKDLKRRPNHVQKAVKGFIATAGTITAVTAAAKVYKKLGNNIVDKIGDWVIKDIKF